MALSTRTEKEQETQALAQIFGTGILAHFIARLCRSSNGLVHDTGTGAVTVASQKGRRPWARSSWRRRSGSCHWTTILAHMGLKQNPVSCAAGCLDTKKPQFVPRELKMHYDREIEGTTVLEGMRDILGLTPGPR